MSNEIDNKLQKRNIKPTAMRELVYEILDKNKKALSLYEIDQQFENVEILGCGTCLQSRNNNEPKVCKFSSMKDLYDLVRKNKIVLTF